MKKFLSLVLALVMTMSLVTISAGAKDFTDDSKINYKEAVDLISAVKVVDGYEDGSFNPTSTLTRGAAAKIICNLILGPTTASALVADAAPYKDVPANSTFAGYIAFCSKEGIISGYADGTFRPGNTLTSYAFMKMLLGALGYDQEVEGYTGANWSINVAKRALNLGLDDGLAEDFNGMKAVTREEACLYALNTLQATMVEYGSKTTVSVGGAEVVLAGSKAEDVWNNAANETIKDDNKMQFAEKYFTNLKLNDEARDDFYRPSNEWKVKADKVGTYPQTPDASYTDTVESRDIYSDLGSEVKAANVTIYVDGVLDGENAPAVKLAKGDDTEVGVSGEGVLTEVYYDKDDESAEIIQINTYVGKVSKTVKATDKKDAYIVIEKDEKNPANSGSLSYETDEKFDDDTVILYTYSQSEKEVESVVKAEKVSGTVTRAENKTVKDEESQNVTIDGTVYKAAATFVGEEVGEVTVKEDYDLYLDSYGYMIKLEKVEDLSSDYAMVLATDTSSDNKIGSDFGSQRARLVFADGATKVVNTAKNYAPKIVDGKETNSNAISNGTIVTYKVDDDGVYTLRAVNTTANNLDNTNKGSAGFKLVNNRAKIEVSAGEYAYGNSSTVYVVYNNDDDEWDAYTGAKNAPSITGNTGKEVEAYWYTKSNTTMATIIFIIPTVDDVVENSGSKLMFIAGESRSNLIHDADGDYYEYNAIVDGELKTIKVNGTATNKDLDGFYNKYKVDKYGIYDGLTAKKSTSTETVWSGDEVETDPATYPTKVGISKTSANYTVKFGYVADDDSFTYTYTVDDKANIYYVDVDGNITESSYGAISKDTNDEVHAIVKDDMIQTLVVVEVDDGDTSGNTSNGSTITVANVTAPKGVKLSVSTTDKVTTVTITGADVDNTVPAADKAEMNTLFGNGLVNADTGKVTAGYAISTIDILSGVKVASKYKITQVNPAMNEIYSGQFTDDTKVKDYNYVDLQDGLAVILKNATNLTLTITPYKADGTTLDDASTVMIIINNSATFKQPA